MEPWQHALFGGTDAPRRRGRRLIVVGVAALMLALPIAVSANHVFSDVPTSSTYHTTTARLVGAGITGGCGGGKYCPNAAVTRGQMAAFLNRGLGRAAQDSGVTVDDDWQAILPGGGGFIAVTFLQIGGVPGALHTCW
jgi:S-layer homology domain